MRECRIITTENEVAALADAWNALSDRVATTPFSDFESSDAWFRHVGKRERSTYHIVTCWTDGQLTGLLPLVVTYKRGLRLMRWIGHDVFFGPIHLFETPEDRRMLWQAAINSTLYDCAKIKYVTPGAPEYDIITQHPSARNVWQDIQTFTRYDGLDGESWAKTLKPNTKKEYNRHKNKLEREGPLTYHVFQKGEIPFDTLDYMMQEKKNWAAALDKRSSIFATETFMHDIIRSAEKKGSLVAIWLACANKPLALELCFAIKGGLYCYMRARAEGLEKFSPGTLSLVYAVKWAADNGYAFFHYMEGRNEYKLRYATHQESIDTYILGATFIGRLAVCGHDIHRMLSEIACKAKRVFSASAK